MHVKGWQKWIDLGNLANQATTDLNEPAGCIEYDAVNFNTSRSKIASLLHSVRSFFLNRQRHFI